MRTSALVASVVLAVLVSGGCAPDRDKTDDTTTDVAVNISVVCSSDGVVAKIPSTIELTSKDNPVWTMDPSSTVSEFSINEKKGNEKWPYGGPLPYTGEKGKPAKGDGKIDSKPAGTKKQYGYSLSATCTPPNGPIKSIVIDPDIIIIWN